ncbi:MAG: preprotein translocase subunit SecA [Flavobacteriales bacterium]|jgi:preprotein translocase subunit SecA|uniref:preprotein translocase subunit SecA n=1 Tax=Blattabacterium sp. (Mastotermes darwiniensis) TaxID=39768 RepID=UPI000231DF0F|nr:preprotein translocase subunit SecA [Blattabacterium sp. (Mastotermes darwiniensis)]AER40835.1 preprotein translocase subunit [Blattabacterium sp. (Mastotermes darwiniensis) str. MADAR]MDR1804682.1 preprotein translocase subunit SecA [Flavobacteriales bacterium]
MGFFIDILKKLLGNKNERDLQEVRKFLIHIKEEEKKISFLSDDELRNKTQEFKDIIKESTKKFYQREEYFVNKIKEKSCSIDTLEKVHLNREKNQQECYNTEQKVLVSLLSKAFAVVKETAKRFKEKKRIIVKSTPLDEEFSKTKPYVHLQKDKAIWKNEWEFYGKSIIWDMVHYDVQLMGGIVLHQGKIAEMATGEGKTFVATLSAYLNALSGRGVHIVTVNNYLSKRDTNWMAPLMEFHGLRVDCIDNYPSSNISMRKKAYQADITYGTNNEFCFDYLRDNMVCSKEELVQRELNYAIIDEIDSVLIDEARTPLVISGPVVHSHNENIEEFKLLKDKIEDIVNRQNIEVKKFFYESRNLIKYGEKKLGGFKLFQAYRGLPKKKFLIKFLSEDKIRFLLQKVESYYLQDNGREMYKVDKDLYFVIDEKNNTVELTDKGIEFLSKNVKDIGFFVLPDINVEITELEKKNFPKEKEIKEKEKILQNFSVKSKRIHTVNQLLKAYTLFERDVDYVVLGGKVKIVDEQTGRIMEGRRYSDGLHQAIEAKENVKIESSSQTLATITLQNYFRMYKKISGMTGTAETESGEFWHIYKLDVVVIPTHKIMIRKDLQDLVFKTKREKYNAIIETIIHLSKYEKRPVLVGTTSVEVSEFLSRALKFRKIEHNVLNAKLHDKEAEIIAKAGLPGSVTIATNMAGRGTDIKLSKEVVKYGGLAVLGTERHDSRRVDNQLRGRSGRQGDPGSSQFYVSLEDNLIRLFIDSERLSKLMDRFGHKEGDIIQHPLLTRSIERAQKKIENNNFSIRKRLLDYDDVINKQREFIYKRRKNALCGEDLNLDISNMVYVLLDIMIFFNKSFNDFKNLEYEFFKIFGIKIPLSERDFFSYKERNCINFLHDLIINCYRKKKEKIVHQDLFPILSNNVKNKMDYYTIQVVFTNGIINIVSTSNLKEFYHSRGESLLSMFEKKTILCFLDEKWKEHLREMDNLRYSVQNAVFEQKDPLIVYKQNAFNLFQERVYEINRKILSFLFQSTIMKNDIVCLPNNNRIIDSFFKEKNGKKLRRNNRINIRHLVTGETKNIKFKKVYFFLEKGEWIIEDDCF